TVAALANTPYTITRDSENGLSTSITDGTIDIKQTYNQFGELKTQKSKAFKLKLKRKQARIVKKTETLVTKVPKKNSKGFKKKKTITKYAYVYDTRDRLTKVKKNKRVVESYTYDNNGNRASATVHGTSITASYTLDDNLVVYGDNTYLYDDDGYLKTKTTPDGTTTYNYGILGELREVVTPTKTISYQHNANN
ncbi:MAG TPA: hypothetical protein EYH57_08435, partial [Sulfurovum sp.]|nr:hypothetical protein [Sulfurovum sp.]